MPRKRKYLPLPQTQTVVTPPPGDPPYPPTYGGAGIAANQYSGLTWGSGAGGLSVPTNTFETWRGRPVDIAAHWIDATDNQMVWWDGSLVGPSTPQGFYGAWTRHMDVSIGAFGKSWGNNWIQTETWKAAGEGAYDARWTQVLTMLKNTLGNRVGPTGVPMRVFIRFAHEPNIPQYPWAFTSSKMAPNPGAGRPGSTRADFWAAWARFRNLQQQIFPESFLVFCPNHEQNDMDATDRYLPAQNPAKWEDWIPPAAQFDVYGVDWYNGWWGVYQQSEWDARINASGHSGSIKGLAQHRAKALELGKPMCIPEWGETANFTGMGPTINGVVQGSNPYPQTNPRTDYWVTQPGEHFPNYGDNPFYVSKMYEWCESNAGTGPGQLLYECYFNVENFGTDGLHHIYPQNSINEVRLVQTAARYQAVWSGQSPASQIPQPSGSVAKLRITKASISTAAAAPSAPLITVVEIGGSGPGLGGSALGTTPLGV